MAPREYKTVHMPEHPKADYVGHVLKHIVVAKQKLGRYLNPGEVVHHIDGNKKNNVPENLMVFATRNDHTAYHQGHSIFKDGDVWKAEQLTRVCEICGKEFSLSQSRINRNQRFCSKECKYSSFIKTQLNNKNAIVEDIIKVLHENNGNFTQTARIFNVTDNALKHRLQKAGLPYLSKDYRTVI